jgi:hypothetical protein
MKVNCFDSEEIKSKRVTLTVSAVKLKHQTVIQIVLMRHNVMLGLVLKLLVSIFYASSLIFKMLFKLDTCHFCQRWLVSDCSAKMQQVQPDGQSTV